MIAGGFLPEEWNADAKRKAWVRQKLEVLGGRAARLKNVGIELVQTLLFALSIPSIVFTLLLLPLPRLICNLCPVSHVFTRHILGYFVSVFYYCTITDAQRGAIGMWVNS